MIETNAEREPEKSVLAAQHDDDDDDFFYEDGFKEPMKFGDWMSLEWVGLLKLLVTLLYNLCTDRRAPKGGPYSKLGSEGESRTWNAISKYENGKIIGW